jgi:dihydroneopterin aldolase
MDFIELKNMIFHAKHGVFPQERLTGNTFRVDMKIYLDLTQAALADDIEQTVSYAEIYRLVADEMAIPSNLLEHLAARIAVAVKHDFPVIEKLRIRVAKSNPPVDGSMEEAAVVMLF